MRPWAENRCQPRHLQPAVVYRERVRQGDLFPGRGETEIFALPDAELQLVRGFLSVADSDRIFAELREGTPWEQERATMYGREVAIPRRTAWYGDPHASYVYSGVRHDPMPWTPTLRELRERIEEDTGRAFNSVLLNFYRDGEDSVSWHSDDERELGPRPVIASLSLGATRVFQLKHKRRADLERIDIELTHGSLLMMSGDCQRHWKHQIPKRRGRNRPGPRINLTFRLVVGGSS